jgi:hypothetical protein
MTLIVVGIILSAFIFVVWENCVSMMEKKSGRPHWPPQSQLIEQTHRHTHTPDIESIRNRASGKGSIYYYPFAQTVYIRSHTVYGRTYPPCHFSLSLSLTNSSSAAAAAAISLGWWGPRLSSLSGFLSTQQQVTNLRPLLLSFFCQWPVATWEKLTILSFCV